jgi:hypothetical protein
VAFLRFEFHINLDVGKVFPEIPPGLPFPKGGDEFSPFEKGGLRGISGGFPAILKLLSRG